ncbi:MAG: hypothetical protein IIC87_06545, partial [Chloroflexi bacterium]|nr:hypothetical protein [Chloroflexota bacterium]
FSVFNELRESMPEQEFRDLFGSVEALNAVLQITGPQAAGMQRTLDEMEGSAGATDKAFADLAATAGFKFKQALAETQAALMAIGVVLLPIAADIASAVATLAGEFTDLSGPVQRAIVVAGGLALRLSAIGLVLPSLITGIKGLRAVVASLRATMILLAATPVGLAILGITAAVAGGLIVWRRWEAILGTTSEAVVTAAGEMDKLTEATARTAQEARDATAAFEQLSAGQLEQTLIALEVRRDALIKVQESLRLQLSTMDFPGAAGALTIGVNIGGMGELRTDITRAARDQKTLEAEISKTLDRLSDLADEANETGEALSRGLTPHLRELSRVTEEQTDRFKTFEETMATARRNAEILGITWDEVVRALQEALGSTKNITAALDAVGAILQGKVNSELAETIRFLLGFGEAADDSKAKVISLTDALSRLGGKKGLGAAAASAKIGAGPGGLFKILAIEKEQGVSFVKAAEIAKEQIREAASFALGGIVPGPVGVAQLAVVHGGETITPPGRARGDTIINVGGITVMGNADDPEAVGREVEEAVDRALGRAALFDEQVRGS